MKHSDSIANLAAALVKAQAELRPVTKDMTNPHFRSKFASLDGIIEAVRPVLAKHGLAFVQGTTTPESDVESKVTAFTVETTLIHTSGEWLTASVLIPLAKADPQGAGSALTYGRRYGLSAALGVATDEDDDANASTPRTTGGSHSRDTAGTASPATAPAGPVMPFGKKKGVPLADLDDAELARAGDWCRTTDAKKFAKLIDQIDTELDARRALAGNIGGEGSGF